MKKTVVIIFLGILLLSACDKTAEQRGADSQFLLGLKYYFGPSAREDKPEAVKWYRKAAEQGYAYASFKDLDY